MVQRGFLFPNSSGVVFIILDLKQNCVTFEILTLHNLQEQKINFLNIQLLFASRLYFNSNVLFITDYILFAYESYKN